MADEVTSSPSTESAEKPAKDISSLIPTDWERKPIPQKITGDRASRFQAVIRQSVLNQIHRHGLAAQEIEVCGVLVGNVYHDTSGPWLYVEYAIEGNHATQRAAQVTFTADTWAHIQSTMDRDYPEKRILGWYHTHPGFGIFLSDMDVFVQENFFPEPWQAAFVYDPKAKEEGLFLWKSNKPDTDPFLVEEDAPKEELTTTVKAAKDVSQPGMVGDAGQFIDRLQSIEKRQKLILALLALIALTAIAWPLIVNIYLPDYFNPKPPPPINLNTETPLQGPR